MERHVYPGEFYRHFKNKLYQIVAVAEHSETGERMVVYQALYGDYRIYVRPYDMFVSEVDHDKYPAVSQQYRFERVMPGKKPGEEWGPGKERVPGEEQAPGKERVPGEEQAPEDEAEPECGRTPGEPNAELLRFLEAETFDERMECLKKLSQSASQRDLDSLYVVLDINPQAGTIGEQVERIRRQLTMQNRYDGSRLR